MSVKGKVLWTCMFSGYNLNYNLLSTLCITDGGC